MEKMSENDLDNVVGGVSLHGKNEDDKVRYYCPFCNETFWADPNVKPVIHSRCKKDISHSSASLRA